MAIGLACHRTSSLQVPWRWFPSFGVTPDHRKTPCHTTEAKMMANQKKEEQEKRWQEAGNRNHRDERNTERDKTEMERARDWKSQTHQETSAGTRAWRTDHTE